MLQLGHGHTQGFSQGEVKGVPLPQLEFPLVGLLIR
jgi:hypothetical protein